MTIFVDFHTITTLGANNLNRGETGAPKTTIYGGVERQLISSQALKKAMRDFVREHNKNIVSIRSRKYIEKVASYINPNAVTDEDFSKAFNMARDYFFRAGFIKKVNEGETKKIAIACFSKPVLQRIAEEAVKLPERDAESDKPISKATLLKELKGMMNEGVSLDVALHGTMVASNPEFNVDASAQIAYAIGVGAFRHEYDFFTAVDDLATDEESGSAMIGETEYGSSTIYRFASLNVEDLAKNLHLSVADTLDYVKIFAEAFIKTLPTGKQNSFASRVLPSYVNITVRNSTPISLVSAFEKPVSNSADAIEALIETKNKFNKIYDELPLYDGSVNVNDNDSLTISELVDGFIDSLKVAYNVEGSIEAVDEVKG